MSLPRNRRKKRIQAELTGVYFELGISLMIRTKVASPQYLLQHSLDVLSKLYACQDAGGSIRLEDRFGNAELLKLL